MTVVAMLFKFGPWVLGTLGILFGIFRHQQAKTSTAIADKEKAQTEAKVSNMEATIAMANEKAVQAGAAAAKERANVENSIASGKSGDSLRVRRRRNDWSRD
ncbi:hypothetical protein [Pandoraea fibrosis]|uniref:hypothetical protein n=1 Tax=Pandoraea fibrosis TaxID=1891094 RepID=UPI00177BCEE0|nr:hypothetical protein [Pandoraea fibrosis]